MNGWVEESSTPNHVLKKYSKKLFIHTKTTVKANNMKSKIINQTFKTHSLEEGKTIRFISQAKSTMGSKSFSILSEMMTHP
jgi:hypothetical protein